jgi:DNA-binding response OmpR family regulator
MMSGIDGLETCRILKKDPLTKDIPIIFVSAKTDIQDIIDGFKVGAVDYINKPIRREEVLVRVHTHLEIVALFKAQEKLSQDLAFDVEQLNKFIVALAGDNADEVVLASFREQFPLCTVM